MDDIRVVNMLDSGVTDWLGLEHGTKRSSSLTSSMKTDHGRSMFVTHSLCGFSGEEAASGDV